MLGVTIAAITGSENAMEKAQDARTKNDEGSMKDAAALKATNLIQEYMDKKYVTNQSLGTGVVTAGDYVASQIAGTEGGFTYAVSGTSLTVTDTKGNSVTGIILDNGNISWGNTSNSDSNSNDGAGDTTPTIADTNITTANYGDYIDLGTHIFSNDKKINSTESVLADWRILYAKKENGKIENLYVILADNLPINSDESLQTLISSVNLSYGADSSESDSYNHVWSTNSLKELLHGLGIIDDGDTYTKYYDVDETDLIAPYYNSQWEALLPTNLINTYSNIKVYGTPTAKLIADSYGENTSTTYNYDNYDGIPFTGSLYLPNDDSTWLATPQGYELDYGYNITNTIQSSDGVYYCDYYNGIRPVVILPANTKIEQNNNGVWEVK